MVWYFTREQLKYNVNPYFLGINNNNKKLILNEKKKKKKEWKVLKWVAQLKSGSICLFSER